MIDEYFEGSAAHDNSAIDFRALVAAAKYVVAALIVTLLFLALFGCGKKPASSYIPEPSQPAVETQTGAAETVTEAKITADAPKTDVPVDVDPKNVVAIIEQPQPSGAVEKTWIVEEPRTIMHPFTKKLKVYQNKAAASPSQPLPQVEGLRRTHNPQRATRNP